MSAAYFLAKRIHFSKSSRQQRVSPPAIRIAIAGIAIGLAVMIVTIAIVIGFKEEIRNKVSDFGGYLQVLALASNRSFEKNPISLSDSLLSEISQIEQITSIEPIITKPAVIKTEDDFLSVVVKSGDAGERGVKISETIARKLNLNIGDFVRLYFVQNSPTGGITEYGQSDVSVKTRSLKITGLYQTHFNQYDEQVIIADYHLLQQVSGWDEDMASGIKIRLYDFSQLEDVYATLSDKVSQTQDRRGTQLCVQTLQHQNPQIFGWLDLLDTNVWVILALMAIVSTFTMISGLLIIILERTQMIGLLKALGYGNKHLRQMFLYIALFLTLEGLCWGNIFGIGICTIQSLWHPVSLDPENYYLEWVPISISWWQIFLLNLGTLIITMCMLILPSSLVSRISPSKILTTE